MKELNSLKNKQIFFKRLSIYLIKLCLCFVDCCQRYDVYQLLVSYESVPYSLSLYISFVYSHSVCVYMPELRLCSMYACMHIWNLKLFLFSLWTYYPNGGRRCMPYNPPGGKSDAQSSKWKPNNGLRSRMFLILSYGGEKSLEPMRTTRHHSRHSRRRDLPQFENYHVKWKS